MGKKVNRKFKIEKFSSLQCEKIYSDPFVIGGCKWKLLAYRKRNDVDYLSLYLVDVADCESLPFEWRRKVYFRLTVVNQLSRKLSVRKETEHWFDGSHRSWGFASMIPLAELHAEDGGFLVNGKIMIEAKVNVLNVIGRLDVSGESDDLSEESLDDDDGDDSSDESLDYDCERFEEDLDDAINVIVHLSEKSEKLPLVKDSEHCFDEKSRTWDYAIPSEILAEDSGFLVNGEQTVVAEVIGTSDVFEDSIPLRMFEVNGFHVLPSQVQSVRRIFERHPDVAVEFRAKNQHLRTTFMNFLTSLIETLYQPLQELSNEDLVEADIALTYLKDVGFKVDWLEKKLNQVKEKKEKERFCEARVQEMEAQLHDLKHKFEMEKAELSATRTPLSFDDIV